MIPRSKLISLVVSLGFLIAGCYSPDGQGSTSTESPEPTQIDEAILQLTFMDRSELYKTTIIGIDVSCLDEDEPCFGEPKKLLTLDYFVSDYSWSPNGEMLAFLGFVGEEHAGEVYVINTDGSELRRITNNNLKEFDVLWSPSGQQLAYTQCARVDWCTVEIHINDFEQDTKLAVDHPELLGVGDISNWVAEPDPFILFNGQRNDGVDQIFSVDLETLEVSLLTMGTDSYWEPNLSPNGKAIVYVKVQLIDDFWHNGFFLVDLESGEEKALTSEIENVYSPKWSPIGDWILFLSGENEENDVYLINVITKEIYNVTNNPGRIHGPNWLFRRE